MAHSSQGFEITLREYDKTKEHFTKFINGITNYIKGLGSRDLKQLDVYVREVDDYGNAKLRCFGNEFLITMDTYYDNGTLKGAIKLYKLQRLTGVYTEYWKAYFDQYGNHVDGTDSIWDMSVVIDMLDTLVKKHAGEVR